MIGAPPCRRAQPADLPRRGKPSSETVTPATTFDKPIVVVTHSVPQPWVDIHPDAPFTFVTDGLPVAIEQARAIAGDLDVSVTAGNSASQCLELGLLAGQSANSL
jgi:hypothetical protein